MIVSLNPATGAELARFKLQGEEAVEHALDAATAAQRKWRRTAPEHRAALLRRIAQALRSDKAELARLISLEMGKPLLEAEAEIEKCAINCDFYADSGLKFLADTAMPSNASESLVVHDPLGVVLAIMPWNYPFWQFFRFLAPALIAGNGAALKHAANVPLCAKAIEDLLVKAGAPNGLVINLVVENTAVAGLIADPRIAAVTLTGSTQVGMIVASQAGKALKKQVLELGGSDPFIVLADADLELAADAAVKARYLNTGQSCINAKRFLVVDAVADQFVDLFVARAQQLKMGDPFEPGVQIGPMARANLRVALDDQVQRTVSAGGWLRLGGMPAAGPGFFYPPTIIDHVLPHMAAFREETFGPVAAITRVADEDEALTMANDTEFGLGASIWTRDLSRAKAFARRIDAGAVFINGVVASDPRLPFGGVKHSGYGRELGEQGMKEFMNTKTIWIGPAV
ncbi:NAD-dependent succinate-semialdehyde dehydrogenase [Phenylobacterium sp.]|jgi:succinate-semialdehyde dehydrogenase/glutarate-semialdehyde dehydrogenase|uniref:NAD-dependent succinate-semialdehyde dehydrogenase n=1 Tax=Phenylobacterium sp. TaxID=1871053 RepID=UPI002F42C9F4